MLVRLAGFVWLGCGLGVNALGAQAAATFTLTDHLKRRWQHELVFFAVDKAVFGRDGLALVGIDYSLVGADGESQCVAEGRSDQ